MDRNEDKNHLQTCSFLTPLLNDDCGLTQEQLRERMDWAIQEAKSDAPLGGISIPPPPENEFQIILAKIKERGITPKRIADDKEEQKESYVPRNESEKEFTEEVSEKETEDIVEKPRKVKEEHAADVPEETRKNNNEDKLIREKPENSKEEPPESETSELIKGKTERKIDELLVKAEKGAENTVEEQDKQRKTEGEERGSKKNVFLQLTKVTGTIAAGIVVTVAAFMLKPGIDVVAKRNYEYKSRIRNEKKGDDVWNNQEDYITYENPVEDAYKQIKEELGISVLKLNYLPEDLFFSKIIVKNKHARLEFVGKNSYLYVTEALNSKPHSENRISDRTNYKTVYNTWIEKNIIIQRNKFANNLVEYNAYFEIENSFYYLEASIEESEFLEIIENLTLE